MYDSLAVGVGPPIQATLDGLVSLVRSAEARAGSSPARSAAQT